jgi:hypothetical protein
MSDIMDAPSWSIEVACAWIVSPSTAAMRLWQDGYRGMEPIDQVGFGILRSQLIKGGISATAIAHGNGGRKTVPTEEWHDIQFSYEFEGDDLAHRAHAAGQEYRQIRLLREDVLSLWPEVNSDDSGVTSGDENRTMIKAAEILRGQEDITKAALEQQLKDLGHIFSDNGFKNRIWPGARKKAGLSASGRAGRRSSGNR